MPLLALSNWNCALYYTMYIRTRSISFLTRKSHSFEQIKKKWKKFDFYVQYIVYVRFRFSFVREFACIFCMWLPKIEENERYGGGKTWKSSSCKLLNKPDERKMNRIVATHIHNLYLISIYDVPSISIWAENRIECRLVYVYRF